MTSIERAKLIEGLRAIEFSETQIQDFQSMLASRITIAEWKERYSEEEKKQEM